MALVSIIIPLRRDQGYLKECVSRCLAQQGVEMEVIILPDESLSWNDPKVRVEPTGLARPARKRNRGAALAKGEILAFIDDDTRPLPGWLSMALQHFSDPHIAAVGGPSITPVDDPFWAQVSGAVYESRFMSGAARLRYVPGIACDVDDFPSCNLLVRRSAFEELGGFGTDFWPGEDTEFCLSLVKKGWRIRYEPEAVIEHHRRPSIRKHIHQLGNYGLHRGYFVKRFPETSFRLPYFLPSFFVLGLVLVFAISLTGNPIAMAALATLGTLYAILMGASLWGKPPGLLFCSICGILVSHTVYGIAFIRGLCTNRLPEEDSHAA